MKTFIKTLIFIVILSLVKYSSVLADTYITGNVSGTWTYVNSPYIVVANIYISDGESLTIEPGTIIKFDSQASMNIYGSLTAEGTESEPIVFTSLKDDTFGGDTNNDGTATTPSSGDWKTISFTGSGIVSGKMRHCVVKYGGASSPQINLSGGGGSNFQITRSTIAYSSHGILYNGAGISVEISSNSVSNNTIGIYAGAGNGLITGNAINSNSSVGINCVSSSNTVITRNIISGSGNIGINCTETTPDLIISDNIISNTSNYAMSCINSLPKLTGNVFDNNRYNGVVVSGNLTGKMRKQPYIILNTVNTYIPAGESLTIEPGTIIKFDSQMSMNVYGSLTAEGTESELIVFTSLKDDSVGGDTNNDGTATNPAEGDWGSLSFTGNDLIGGKLHYCVAKYGGYRGGGQINISTYNSAIFEIARSTMVHGSAYGLSYAGAKASIEISSNSINSNTNGIYAGTGISLISGNEILGNKNIGIHYISSNTIVLDNRISENKIGIYCSNAGPSAIHYNRIMYNSDYGIFNAGVSTVNAENNWWGISSGPQHSSNPLSIGDKVSDRVDFIPWLTDPTGQSAIAYDSVSEAEISYNNDKSIYETVSNDSANISLSAAGVLNGTIECPAISLCTVKTGAYSNSGFIDGNFNALLESINYAGAISGNFYLDSQNNCLRGNAVMQGRITGFISFELVESLGGSGTYDLFYGTCSFRLADNIGAIVGGTMFLSGNINTVSHADYYSTALVAKQLLVSGELSDGYTGSITGMVSSLLIADANHPENGSGFCSMTYQWNEFSGRASGFAHKENENTAYKLAVEKPLFAVAEIQHNEISNDLRLLFTKLGISDEPQPHLLMKLYSPPSYSPGQLISYTIELKNLGTCSAQNKLITFQLPAELRFVSASGKYYYTNLSTESLIEYLDPNTAPEIITWQLPEVQNNSIQTFTLQCKALWMLNVDFGVTVGLSSYTNE